MSKRMWRLIGIVILIYIFSRLDWRQMERILKEADGKWLFVAFLFNVLPLWIKSIRWHLILASQNLKVGKVDTFLFYMSAFFMGVVTPGRLGELAKAFYLKQHNITSLAFGFSSVVVDRLCDLSVLVVLGIVGLIKLTPWPHIRSLGIVLLLSAAVFFVIWTMAIDKHKHKRWFSIYRQWIVSKLPSPIQKHVDEFTNGIACLHGTLFFAALILTVFGYAIYFFQCFFISKAFFIRLSYWDMVYIMSLTNLFSFLPVSISGLGTREVALLFFLKPRGIPIESIIAFSMGIFVVFFVGGGIFGAIAWWLRPMDFKTINKET